MPMCHLCPGDTMVPKMPPCICTTPPHDAPTEKGVSFPTPGLCQEWGGCRGGRCIRMFMGVLSSSSVLLPAPSSPLEP